MAISIQEHRRLLTNKLVAEFMEVKPVRSGLSAFFPRETTHSLEIDIEVERDTEYIAVDVQRFSEGSSSKMSKTTERKYIPPYFLKTYFFNKDMVYINNVSNGVTNVPAINRKIAQNAMKVIVKNRLQIERAILKQQWQVLQTGIVTMSNGDNIDYLRKGASKPVLTGNALWSAASTCKPLDDLKTAGEFLRNEGNSSGNTINAVMRSGLMSDFFASTQVRDQADIRRIDRVNVGMPQFENATGLTFHGQIAAGDYIINLWTFNERYRNENETIGYYLDSNKVVILPEDFEGKTVFGGLFTDGNVNIEGVDVKAPQLVEAEYVLRPFSNDITLSSGLQLMSAPLVIPVSVDKIYTIQALA